MHAVTLQLPGHVGLTPGKKHPDDHTLFHFTQEKQPESKFSNNSSKLSGIRLFISFIYSV